MDIEGGGGGGWGAGPSPGRRWEKVEPGEGSGRGGGGEGGREVELQEVALHVRDGGEGRAGVHPCGGTETWRHVGPDREAAGRVPMPMPVQRPPATEKIRRNRGPKLEAPIHVLCIA